jgi:imidazole glycerol-phosphate synthase subunit HisF
MLRCRVIPCLLVHKGGLVKTVNFDKPRYVGDPLNAVRIFNEKKVDELIVLNIDASVLFQEPDYDSISDLAGECRMPLCYGGGVKTPEQIEKIIGLGVEKVAISSAALTNPDLVAQAAERVGSQSIVVVLDIKKVGVFSKSYAIFINNGRDKMDIGIVEAALRAQEMGAGELVINNIDRDGSLQGFDTDLIDLVHNAVDIPITVLGGASCPEDFEKLSKRYKILGMAAGSLFVLTGKYRAVLIQYLSKEQKSRVINTESKN